MTQVFLSHSSDDGDFVDRLAGDLRGDGFNVWKAPESIQPGEPWVKAIERGLATSSHFVLVMSPAAARSRWVDFEMQTAIHLERAEQMVIIPVDYLPCVKPLFWNTYQAISFNPDRYDKGLASLTGRLRAAQPLSPPTPAPQTVYQHAVLPQRPPEPPPAPSPSGSYPAGGEEQGRDSMSLKEAVEVFETFLDMSSQDTASERGTGRGLLPTPALITPTPDPILDLLPPPFEWIDIPAGQVTLEAGGYVPPSGQTFHITAFKIAIPGQTFHIEAFKIARYPLTNAQFQVFVESAGGYRQAHWWDYSPEAQHRRTRKSKPRDPAWGGLADHPRVNVTWFEAVAFCRWLSQQVGYEVRLPTEQEWQRAAQGDDGRRYPWGNEHPDKTRANWKNNVGQTTPVDHYPDGASPYRVLDMAGNVWEWCATDYETGSQDVREAAKHRVVRGCAWNSTYYVDAVERHWGLPVNGVNYIGFRCARFE